MTEQLPQIERHSIAVGNRPSIEYCTVWLLYAADRPAAQITFEVHDRLTRGDTNEAWMEDLGRISDALHKVFIG